MQPVMPIHQILLQGEAHHKGYLVDVIEKLYAHIQGQQKELVEAYDLLKKLKAGEVELDRLIPAADGFELKPERKNGKPTPEMKSVGQEAKA